MTEPIPRAYVAARIAAFVTANANVRLCDACWRQLPRNKLAERPALNDPGRCARCGRNTATSVRAVPLASFLSRPARPRRARRGNRAA
jgi:hypothetical protein